MSAQPVSITLADEINLLRRDPPAYAIFVQQHLDRFVDDYIYKKPTGSKIRTKEGVKSELFDYSISFTSFNACFM